MLSRWHRRLRWAQLFATSTIFQRSAKLAIAALKSHHDGFTTALVYPAYVMTPFVNSLSTNSYCMCRISEIVCRCLCEIAPTRGLYGAVDLAKKTQWTGMKYCSRSARECIALGKLHRLWPVSTAGTGTYRMSQCTECHAWEQIECR